MLAWVAAGLHFYKTEGVESQSTGQVHGRHCCAQHPLLPLSLGLQRPTPAAMSRLGPSTGSLHSLARDLDSLLRTWVSKTHPGTSFGISVWFGTLEGSSLPDGVGTRTNPPRLCCGLQTPNGGSGQSCASI